MLEHNHLAINIRFFTSCAYFSGRARLKHISKKLLCLSNPEEAVRPVGHRLRTKLRFFETKDIFFASVQMGSQHFLMLMSFLRAHTRKIRIVKAAICPFENFPLRGDNSHTHFLA